MDFPECTSSIYFMYTGVLISYRVSLVDSYNRSVRGGKQTSLAPFYRVSYFPGRNGS